MVYRGPSQSYGLSQSLYNWSLLSISNAIGEKIFEVSHDGDIFIRIDGEMHKIEHKKEVGLSFALAVLQMLKLDGGAMNITEDEIINKIVTHYRDKQLGKLTS